MDRNWWEKSDKLGSSIMQNLNIKTIPGQNDTRFDLLNSGLKYASRVMMANYYLQMPKRDKIPFFSASKLWLLILNLAPYLLKTLRWYLGLIKNLFHVMHRLVLTFLWYFVLCIFWCDSGLSTVSQSARKRPLKSRLFCSVTLLFRPQVYEELV